MATTQQLTVKSVTGSGAETDVTEDATYKTSDNEVCTVNNAGLISAVGVGTATVTATYEGKSGTCAVTVTDPVTSVNVTPATAALTVPGE